MLFYILMAPFFLQGIVFSIDEFVFHHRRGLPLWERLGHPIDTASIILPLAFAWRSGFSPSHLAVFAGLGLLSCIIVTKDEFVHAEVCEPREQWLHGLLFVLHPLLFVSAGLLWYLDSIGASPIPVGLDVNFVLRGQVLFLASIMAYQIIYWSFIWQPKKSRSTTKFTIHSVNAGILQRTIR